MLREMIGFLSNHSSKGRLYKMRKVLIMLMVISLLSSYPMLALAVEPDQAENTDTTVLQDLVNHKGHNQMESVMENVYMLNNNNRTTNIHGSWIQPFTDHFVLEGRSVPVRFWLEKAPSETPSFYIFDASTDITIGNEVAVITEDQLRTGKGGKGIKNRRENQTQGYWYYKCNLKTWNLPFLQEGSTYVLAVMIGDELLAFDEDTPASMSFTVGEDAFKTRWATKLNMGCNNCN